MMTEKRIRELLAVFTRNERLTRRFAKIQHPHGRSAQHEVWCYAMGRRDALREILAGKPKL